MTFWLLMLAAIDAPVTQVTVFSDQARVVRTAQVQISGTQRVEFPSLRDSADVSSIRVEATGATVKRVDLERLSPEAIRTDEAKKVLAAIDALDLEVDRLSQEQAVLQSQRDALQRIAPVAPTGDPLKPAPKLNGAAWGQGVKFASDELAVLQNRIRDGERALKKKVDERQKRIEEAYLLGNPGTTSGWLVVAEVSGSGPATVTLSYVVLGAQWTPTWDLQLNPDSNTVSLSLAGLVTQSTGEDWSSTSLLLSTAIPSRAVEAPKLASWKIGVVDRFIPTPTPLNVPIVPPPPVRPLAVAVTEDQRIRARLQQVAPTADTRGDRRAAKDTQYEFEDETIDGELGGVVGGVAAGKAYGAPAPAPPPEPAAPTRSYEALTETVTLSSQRGSIFSSNVAPQPVAAFSLSPPPSWVPPNYGSNSPVTLAGGFDLSFASLQKETIPSARGGRRVALWSAQWPVTVERKLFPALTKDAYLVAELKNPSQQVLPGGPAQLFVGADPAGVAQLELVSPGESFTLPLGIDRALKPVRNVQVTEETKGVISKDEIGTYTVTIELVNPYRAPIQVRVIDQYPLTTQDKLETKLLQSKPQAAIDAVKGALEWRVSIAPQQKQVFTFSYQVKRPRGWKLSQQEVVK